MKKYAEGGLSRRDMPSDLVNFDALPDTPPPREEPKPKRKLTREESLERVRRAKEGDGPQGKMSGRVIRYAKGGSVTRGDGICKKGHTKGTMR